MPRGLIQLHEWELWRGRHGEAAAAWPPLSARLRKRCRDAFAASRLAAATADGPPAAFRREVLEVLAALSVPHRTHVRISGHLADAVVLTRNF